MNLITGSGQWAVLACVVALWSLLGFLVLGYCLGFTRYCSSVYFCRFR